jgi:hypothetical protein
LHNESYTQHVKELYGRKVLEDPGVDGKTILKWIFEMRDGGITWTVSIWLRIGTGGWLL